MATQLTTQLQARIDGTLDSFEREMRWAVDMATSWEEAEEIERIDLAAEWGLIMDFYLSLLRYEREWLLTPTQQHRFDTIRDLFRRHEAQLAQVLDSNLVTSDPPQSWFS